MRKLSIRERLAGKPLIGFAIPVAPAAMVGGKPLEAPAAMVGTEVRRAAPQPMVGLGPAEARAPRAMVGNATPEIRAPRAMVGRLGGEFA